MPAVNDIDLFLVIPPGLDRSIYPWGVQSLSDYVSHCDVAEPRIWALGEEPWLEEVFEAHAAPLRELLDALTRAARGVFFGHTSNPYLYLGVAGALGAELLDIAERRGLLRFPGLSRRARGRLAAALDELKRAYGRQIRAGVESCIELSAAEGGGARRRAWGITVYDYTLFNSLCLSRVVRELDPTALVLLGGDYFDYRAAGEVIQEARWVDGLVVGYGEEVLRQVLAAHGDGVDVGALDLTGLVTRASLARQGRAAAMSAADLALGLGKASKAERESSVSVPASYRGGEDQPPVDYVQTQEDGTIRVLTQRGCSWGKCTFCSQIDRRLFFSLGLDAILAQLDAALREPPPGPAARRRVSLDADENDLNAVLPLLDTINRAPGTYHVEFWLMVRKFGVELPRFLVNQSRNMRLQVILNVESFSQQTLKRMKKGVVPLQIVEAIKAIQDAGHVVQTNYFLNYPAEDVESVAEEVEILERVVHLFAPERMLASAFSYMANTRDEIHFDQERYGIASGRVPEDVWLREVFGVDLPFSIWTLRYEREVGRVEPRALIPFTYHKMSFARRAAMLTRTARQVLAGATPETVGRRLAEAVEGADLHAWRLAHAVAQWCAGDTAYDRRRAVFDHLDDVARGAAARQGGRPAGAPAPAPAPSRFHIEGAELVKEWHLPGAEERSRRALSERELTLLRHLYWRRKRADVERRFADWGEGVAAALIARHQAIGSVMSDGHSLLSVVHDPGYWKTEASLREGPSARTDLEPRLPELATLRPKRRVAVVS